MRRLRPCSLALLLGLAAAQAANEPTGAASPSASATRASERPVAAVPAPAAAAPAALESRPQALPAERAERAERAEPAESVEAADPAAPRPRAAPPSLLDQPLQRSPGQWRGVPQPPGEALPALREWLVVSRNLAEAQAQRQALQPWRLTILRRQRLLQLGQVVSVYRIPPEVDLKQLEAELRRRFPDWLQELNQRYRPLAQPAPDDTQALRNWGQRAIGRVPGARCAAGVVLAMLDGPLNTQLEVFAAADVHYQSLLPAQYQPRDEEAARHATAVAALLVGRGQVAGLLPGASLQALGIFGDDGEVGLHTRSDWVLQALDWAAGLQPPARVVNLSFGGGYSGALERGFARLAERLRFVAAAGNDGLEQVRYPAAYPGVMAVGAVDIRLRRLRQSNYGRQLALVAPGGDIWTLDEQGQGYFASGTSFAAPFASAALALSPSPARLTATALDLGKPGRDADYGAGLVQMPVCR